MLIVAGVETTPCAIGVCFPGIILYNSSIPLDVSRNRYLPSVVTPR